MDVKKFENKRWTKSDQKIEFRHKEALTMIKGGNILDLGSGNGLFLSLLAQKGITGKGLDISNKGVSIAREKGVDAFVFDFENPIPFENNSFDFVVMLDLLEHLYDPASLLREAVRVSKKSIIISVPNFNSLPARLQVLFGGVPENNLPQKAHVFWFNYHVLMKMVKDNHLSVEELRINTFLNSWFFIGETINFFAKIMPSIFALSFVIKLNK